MSFSSKLAWMELLVSSLTSGVFAQSADWQSVVWREPQVRYLLADMTLGGNVAMYRDYAAGRDPDSREAIRLWDAGVRVVNTNEIERRWLTNQFGKDGRVMRVVQRGSDRTVTGDDLRLSNEGVFSQAPMRLVLLDLTLGCPVAAYQERGRSDLTVAEALRRWNDGCRAVNVRWFTASGKPPKRRLHFASTGLPMACGLS